MGAASPLINKDCLSSIKAYDHATSETLSVAAGQSLPITCARLMHCLSKSLHGSVSEDKDKRAFWDVIEILGHYNVKLINKHSVDSMRGKLLKGQKLLIGLSALYEAVVVPVDRTKATIYRKIEFASGIISDTMGGLTMAEHCEYIGEFFNSLAVDDEKAHHTSDSPIGCVDSTGSSDADATSLQKAYHIFKKGSHLKCCDAAKLDGAVNAMVKLLKNAAKNLDGAGRYMECTLVYRALSFM
eukprot:3648559-Amphidinium_carterae.1